MLRRNATVKPFLVSLVEPVAYLKSELETEPDAKLHRPGVIALRTDYTPSIWACNIVGRIVEHRVVEKVSHDELELGVDALDDLDVFRHSHIHVPIAKSTDISVAACPGVNTQNWVANRGKHACGVRKQVKVPVVVVQRGIYFVPFREDALFVAEEIGAIGRAERLPVGIGVAIGRCPAPNRENRRNLPASEDMTGQTMLTLVEGRFIQAVDVVHELSIEVLQPVHVVEVECIVGRVFAGGLDESPGT